jgi:Raf kinase inhibitor-like YbhB/YbcL family protein
MRIFSSAFADGGWIPPLHSCKGADVSPSLEWTDPPAGTRSYVLIVDDPDAPGGTWLHWLLYDIPAKVHTLAQGSRGVGTSGTNSFKRTGYGGPCPPAGAPHHYYFKLSALDVDSLGLKSGASRADVERAMNGHILGEASYLGRFKS